VRDTLPSSPQQSSSIQQVSYYPQEFCLRKTSTILQQLKDDGLANIPFSLIPEWSTLADLHSLPSALILVDRLQFLWTTIEQWKVSLAWNHNALMTACGYIYRGHDFGWIRNLGHLRGQNLSWFMNSTTEYSAIDTPRISSVHDRYLLQIEFFGSRIATTYCSKSSKKTTSASFAKKQVTWFSHALTLLVSSKQRNFTYSRNQNRKQVAH
jgi:hypothetical protein